MSLLPDVLWLNVSPVLSRFHVPLLQVLSQQVVIAQWDYLHTLDEPNSFDAALVMLHDYLNDRDRPIHLMGHSSSGLLGLLYARQHPERVKSLTLLSVGADPAIDWQAHYYAQRKLLPYRRMVLAQMVHTLAGCQSRPMLEAWMNLLERDLLTSLSPHTLFRQISIPPGGVPVPLLVCRGGEDLIVDANLFDGWLGWLKSGDRRWTNPQGKHFFHADYPETVGDQVLNFWASLPNSVHPTTALVLSSL